MPAGVKKKQRRRYRNEQDSVMARFISDSSSDSDFEVRIPHVKYSDYKKKSKGCTTTEKSLCAVIVVFIVICAVLAALLVAQFVLNVGACKKQEACTSPSCVEVAGKLLSRMDLAEKPCDDFYQYTCGAWLADFTLPPDKSVFSMFTYVSERNTARLRKLISEEGSLLMGQNSTAVKKSKNFYQACMDTKGVEQKGIKPMLKLIRDLGSWTVTSGESGTWDRSTWNLLTMLTTLHKTGGSGLFDMSVAEDLRNVDEHIIQFDQSGLTFGDRSFYLDVEMSKKYKSAFLTYFSSVTVLLGADNATAYQVAEDIWEFEKLIANITTPPEDRQDMEKLYHKMTVADLQDIMGGWISLRDYMKAIFGFTISQSREILVFAPEFLRKIGDIVSGASKSTLANYLVWHGMNGGISYLTYPFHQADLALSAALSGVSARPPEWKICISRATSSLPQATGALFVEKYFSSDDRKKAEDILRRIKADFRAHIPDLKWMDETTKQRAIEKVDAVQDKIGFPDMAQDPPVLDAYYGNMIVTDNDPFQNWINIKDFYVQKNLKKLSKRPDRTEWYMAPNEVNAYYSPSTNQMVFPAGILQYPFYDPSFPMAVNYGSIGMVMGHELTHGFDNSGRQYDKYGNLKNWWNQASTDAFLERTECIINQYNQFPVGKKHVNGKLTQGENIADNGGIKTAFGAYRTWLEENGGKEERAHLPALNMTEDQAFFVGFGQIWCSFRTPEYAEQALTTDVHSPPRARVLGSLQNMQEFSDTFSCRPGTPMNAKTKCVVW